MFFLFKIIQGEGREKRLGEGGGGGGHIPLLRTRTTWDDLSVADQRSLALIQDWLM